MIDERDEPEIPELGALPREIDPGPGLEDAIVGRLRLSGLVAPRRRIRTWLAAAAVIAAFAGGWLAGRQTAAPEDAAPASVNAPANETPASAAAVPSDVPPGTTITWF